LKNNYNERILLKTQLKKIIEAVSPRVTPSNVSNLYNSYVLVDSSNIHSFFYNPSNREMRVRFLPKEEYDQGGAEYIYYNVPERIFIQLLNADSHGSKFWKLARTKFRYERLADWTDN